MNQSELNDMIDRGRVLEEAAAGDPELGPLTDLPGVWSNEPDLPGRGWNMIALPSGEAPPFDFRLLVNQYNETLSFKLVDKAVPNRGVDLSTTPTSETDQFLVALDYQQTIDQILADDSPKTDKAGSSGLSIHHEPGLWIHMTNQVTNGLDVARQSLIPHGNSVLALGSSSTSTGAVTVPVVDALPIGIDDPTEALTKRLENEYLAPYRHFHENLFAGLFDPVQPHLLLQAAADALALDPGIVSSQVLAVDTGNPTGGVLNIPFVERQADASTMRSTFWIHELADGRMALQYIQVVILDFFERRNGNGLIGWPHVSINTMFRQ